MSEAQLAAHVVAWLKAEGWQVFEEVEWTVGRADIIATRAHELVAFECKKQLSFDVMAQARRWLPHVTAAYVAVAAVKSSEGRRLAFEVVKLLGLRVVDVLSLWPIEAGRVCPITLRGGDYTTIRRVNPDLLETLRPEHQTHAKAGTNRGGQVTAFKLTCGRLHTYAVANPGCLLRTALSMVEHHYRGGIGRAIETLVAIDAADLAALGVRLEVDAETEVVRLFPVEVTP